MPPRPRETLQPVNIPGNCFGKGGWNGQFNYIGLCTLISLISQLMSPQIAWRRITRLANIPPAKQTCKCGLLYFPLKVNVNCVYCFPTRKLFPCTKGPLKNKTKQKTTTGNRIEFKEVFVRDWFWTYLPRALYGPERTLMCGDL